MSRWKSSTASCLINRQSAYSRLRDCRPYLPKPEGRFEPVRRKTGIRTPGYKVVNERLSRLYQAVVTRILPLNQTLQRRVQQAKSARETVLIETAGLSRLQSLPVERIQPSQVETFGKLIGKKLRDRSSLFGRLYLRVLIDKVVVNGNNAVISGTNARLMQAVAGKKPLSAQVPSFMIGVP